MCVDVCASTEESLSAVCFWVEVPDAVVGGVADRNAVLGSVCLRMCGMRWMGRREVGTKASVREKKFAISFEFAIFAHPPILSERF